MEVFSFFRGICRGSGKSKVKLLKTLATTYKIMVTFNKFQLKIMILDSSSGREKGKGEQNPECRPNSHDSQLVTTSLVTLG